MQKHTWFLGLIILISLVVGACSPAETEAPVQVRIGALSILDSLPFYVAEAQGYFEEAGLDVEIIPVASAPERDQLMQSGQVEVILNELVATLYYNRDGSRIKIVRFARIATGEYPLFRILAAANSGIQTPADLVGAQIGISEGTVIEYVTDRLLESQGIDPADVEKIIIPKIPDRLALLRAGELQCGMLPDPAASLVVMGGAWVVLDDTVLPEISNSVISMSTAFLEAHPEAARAFLAAIEKAVTDINADKDQWTDLMVEQGFVPPPLVGSYAIPDFPAAGVPSEAQFADALDWVQQTGAISVDLHYADSVSDAYLPE